MSVDLDRALKDPVYRESVVGLSDPAVELLKRAGAYAQPIEEPGEDSSPYLSADPVREMHTIRAAVPLDPTLAFEALQPFFASAFGRAVVAAHPSTPASTLLELAGDEAEAVQKVVLENRKIGVEVLERLSRSKFEQVRLNLLHHHLLPSELRARMIIEDPTFSVRRSAFFKSNPDGPALARALERDPELARDIAEHKNVTEETLLALAASSDPYVRREVAKQARAPVEALERIVNQELDYELRQLVMKHPNLPRQWVLDQLIAAGPEVRRMLARRTDLSAEAQLFCASDADSGVRNALAGVATDPRALSKLFANSGEGIRMQLAQNRHTPIEILRELRDGPDYFIARKARETLVRLGHE